MRNHSLRLPLNDRNRLQSADIAIIWPCEKHHVTLAMVATRRKIPGLTQPRNKLRKRGFTAKSEHGPPLYQPVLDLLLDPSDVTPQPLFVGCGHQCAVWVPDGVHGAAGRLQWGVGLDAHQHHVQLAPPGGIHRRSHTLHARRFVFEADI